MDKNWPVYYVGPNVSCAHAWIGWRRLTDLRPGDRNVLISASLLTQICLFEPIAVLLYAPHKHNFGGIFSPTRTICGATCAATRTMCKPWQMRLCHYKKKKNVLLSLGPHIGDFSHNILIVALSQKAYNIIYMSSGNRLNDGVRALTPT